MVLGANPLNKKFRVIVGDPIEKFLLRIRSRLVKHRRNVNDSNKKMILQTNNDNLDQEETQQMIITVQSFMML